MKFENLIGMLHFYSSSSEDGKHSIIGTANFLKSSLSEYSNIKIINCGSFEEQLYMPLIIVDLVENETTLNFDTDHLIVDMDYSAYEINDVPVDVENKKNILTFKNSHNACCVYVYDCQENLDIPWKSADFMLQQIQKYRPEVGIANGINFENALGLRTGPSFAATSGVGGTLGHYTSTDLVFCVHCQQWPSIAKEWLIRKSKTGWPTPDIKHLIEINGCYIVPTGYDENEWRLSFSLAELQLIDTLDSEYKRIYAIVKFLIKYTFTSENIIGLKSYHLKTIFLWYCEERGFEKNVSIRFSIESLLNYISEYYERKYIPHYFIPTFNLLFEKSDNEFKVYYSMLSKLLNNLDITIIHFIENTYYSFILLDTDFLELYSKNDSRLLLFFKYNFLLYSLFGLLDNEPTHESSKSSTNIDYYHYFSLVSMNNEINVTIDNILKTIAFHIHSDNELLSLEEISGIICAVWWCAFNLKVGRSSHLFYDCIFWATQMHANHCSTLIDGFIHKAPKIICKTNDSENYKNLLSIIFHHPTKQTKNFNRYSLIKMKDECRTLFKILLTTEAEYLINYNIEMAFCVLQIIACMERESLLDFFVQPAAKTLAKMLKERHEDAFGIFGKWVTEDETAGIKTCQCEKKTNGS